MSPTSYQTAPPREFIIATAILSVKPPVASLDLPKDHLEGIFRWTPHVVRNLEISTWRLDKPRHNSSAENGVIRNDR
jgi:hypothetical protein